MRKNKVIVRERDAKHCPRQLAHDGALKADCFFGIHYGRCCEQRGPECFRGRLCKSTPDLPAIARKTVRAVRTRTLFAWTSFVHVQRAAIKFLAIERILGPL